MKILTAPEYCNYEDFDKESLIFLAGPIQGAPNWQNKAIDYFSKRIDTIIANPRRAVEREGNFDTKKYNEQVEWEGYHLNAAEKYGVIMFWLAKEEKHDCSRAYAQTTRFELAEHVAYTVAPFRKPKLAIGVEEGFSGAKYIRKRVPEMNNELKIYSTLEETCDETIRLMKL